MKCIKTLKDKRDELQKDLELYLRELEKVKVKAHGNKGITNLEGDEKFFYYYLTTSVRDLKTQIDVMNFVLNDDYEMRDATYHHYYAHHHGLTKELLFGNEGDCNCYACIDKRRGNYKANRTAW